MKTLPPMVNSGPGVRPPTPEILTSEPRRALRCGHAARVGAKTLSIKVMKLGGGLRVTVVSKGSRQELHVYGLTAERVGEILSGPDFAGYKLNFADE